VEGVLPAARVEPAAPLPPCPPGTQAASAYRHQLSAPAPWAESQDVRGRRKAGPRWAGYGLANWSPANALGQRPHWRPWPATRCWWLHAEKPEQAQGPGGGAAPGGAAVPLALAGEGPPRPAGAFATGNRRPACLHALQTCHLNRWSPRPCAQLRRSGGTGCRASGLLGCRSSKTAETLSPLQELLLEPACFGRGAAGLTRGACSLRKGATASAESLRMCRARAGSGVGSRDLELEAGELDTDALLTVNAPTYIDRCCPPPTGAFHQPGGGYLPRRRGTPTAGPGSWRSGSSALPPGLPVELSYLIAKEEHTKPEHAPEAPPRPGHGAAGQGSIACQGWSLLRLPAITRSFPRPCPCSLPRHLAQPAPCARPAAHARFRCTCRRDRSKSRSMGA